MLVAPLMSIPLIALELIEVGAYNLPIILFEIVTDGGAKLVRMPQVAADVPPPERLNILFDEMLTAPKASPE